MYLLVIDSDSRLKEVFRTDHELFQGDIKTCSPAFIDALTADIKRSLIKTPLIP
jgi:hypothetical protein